VAYLHLFPPHEPYCPRREFVGIFEDGWMPVTKEPHRLSPGIPQSDLNQWRMEYDEYVTHSDAEFGRLRGFLDGSGLMDRSIVILTSDHGQLFERGVHGHDTDLLYEPVIRIPLLISWPGERRRHDILDLTSCVDLIPTLMEAVGKEIPDWCEGNTLPRWDTEHVGHERTIFSVEAKRNPAHGPLHVGTIALLRGHHKLIHYLGRGDPDNTYELYNLADDPEEMENLYADGSSIAAELEGELKEKLSQINRIDTRP
jgi:arylsulfatase A-like enzyme